MSAAAGAVPATLKDVAGLPAADQSLPILEGVLNRSTYRSRPEEEAEEATWYSPDEPDTLVEPQQVHLKSIHSKQSSVIVFSNKTPYRVRALWLDFKGDEVVYSVLEPNSTKRYHTYITHPWLVREVGSGTRMLLSGRPAVVGMSTEQVVEVQAPPELRWSLDTHSCFPAPFKASVRALLLSHKELERLAAAAPAAAATPTAARRDPASPGFKRLACSSPAPAAAATLDTTPQAPLSPRSTARVSLVMATPPAPACDQPDAAAAAAWPCSPRAAARRQLLPACLSPSARAPPVAVVMPAVATSPRRAPSPAGACYGAGSSSSAAGPAAASSSTTSISISTEAANFTLTLTSPKRSSSSALKSMTSLNIAFNTSSSSGGGSSTTTTMINLDTVLGGSTAAAGTAAAAVGGGADEAACTATDGDLSSSSGGRSRKKHGLFNNLMSNFKALMKPRPAACDAACPTTHITLEVSHSPEPDASHGSNNASSSSMMDVDGCCWAEAVARDAAPWAHAGTHLGHLPSHLLAVIAELAAPTVYQSALMPAKGKPDILPVLMACRPRTKEEEEADALAAAQQQQQDDDDDDEIPPLI